METKHTPGPLQSREGCWIHDEAGEAIAVVLTPIIGDHLVACSNACEGINPEAVPNMLKTLVKLSEWLERNVGELPVLDDDWEDGHGELADVLHVIKQATRSKP